MVLIYSVCIFLLCILDISHVFCCKDLFFALGSSKTLQYLSTSFVLIWNTHMLVSVGRVNMGWDMGEIWDEDSSHSSLQARSDFATGFRSVQTSTRSSETADIVLSPHSPSTKTREKQWIRCSSYRRPLCDFQLSPHSPSNLVQSGLLTLHFRRLTLDGLTKLWGCTFIGRSGLSGQAAACHYDNAKSCILE